MGEVVTTSPIGARSGESRLGRISLVGRIEGGRGVVGQGMRRYPSYALTFVTAGVGSYVDAGGRREVAAGTMVLVFPGRPHWYGTAGSAGSGRGTWDETFLVFDGPVFRLAEQQGLIRQDRVLLHGLPVLPWRRRLDAFRLSPRPTAPGARDAEALELLALLAEAGDAAGDVAGAVVGGKGESGASGGDWFARSVDLLESDLDRTLSMPQVAGRVGLPYETWRRRFRACAGVGPQQYRALHRLDTVTDLLVHTSLSTREMAAALGYSDERHLIRRFRERTGVTPRQYRDGADQPRQQRPRSATPLSQRS